MSMTHTVGYKRQGMVRLSEFKKAGVTAATISLDEGKGPHLATRPLLEFLSCALRRSRASPSLLNSKFRDSTQISYKFFLRLLTWQNTTIAWNFSAVV